MQASLDSFLKRPVRIARLAALLFVPVVALSLAASPAQGMSGAGPTLRALSGAEQQTSYASSFAKPLTVWVCDPATERSLAGVRVNFTASAGIRLSESSIVTDDNGLASVMATSLDVGTSSVKAEIGGDSSSAVSFDNLVVNKAVLTIVPVDVQSTVGVIPPITEYTIQGFVNGDTEDSAQISGVPVLSTIATESSPDANYAIKGNVGSLESPKYTFKPGFGALVLRGMGKASRPETAKTAPGIDPLQYGSPVVQSAIQPTKVDAPVALHLGTVHKANVLPSIEVAHPTPLLGSAVHQAVKHQLVPSPSGTTGGVVRPGVLGQSATPASTLAGEFVQGVHSALPNVTQGPVSPKTSRIRKALNPPTPN
jgi:hypothetical protein